MCCRVNRNLERCFSSCPFGIYEINVRIHFHFTLMCFLEQLLSHFRGKKKQTNKILYAETHCTYLPTELFPRLVELTLLILSHHIGFYAYAPAIAVTGNILFSGCPFIDLFLWALYLHNSLAESLKSLNLGNIIFDSKVELSDFGRLRSKVNSITSDPNYKTRIRFFECFEGFFFRLGTNTHMDPNIIWFSSKVQATLTSWHCDFIQSILRTLAL